MLNLGNQTVLLYFKFFNQHLSLVLHYNIEKLATIIVSQKNLTII